MQVADIACNAMHLVIQTYVCSNDFNFTFSYSTFTNNTATTDGTVLLIRFGAIFEGTNTFTGNSGGGIVLVLARMDSRGNLWFQNNSALDGAGVLMQEHCLVS